MNKFATALFASTLVFAEPGSLVRVDKGGEQAICPLKHTDVKAEISGTMARVLELLRHPNPGHGSADFSLNVCMLQRADGLFPALIYAYQRSGFGKHQR